MMYPFGKSIWLKNIHIHTSLILSSTYSCQFTNPRTSSRFIMSLILSTHTIMTYPENFWAILILEDYILYVAECKR